MLFETQSLSDFSIAAIMGKRPEDKKSTFISSQRSLDLNDVEVDVEECSDNETGNVSLSEDICLSEDFSRTSYCSSSSPQRIKSESSSDEERTSPVTSRPKIEGSCNSEDLKSIQCHLETKELWDKFDDLGTEMIITKSGRRMFPTLRVSFSGPLRQSHPTDRYVVLMDIVPFDSRRYRYAYHRSSWLVAGKADPPPAPRLYAHPDTPLGPDVLRRQVISFEKVKLTNDAKEGKKELIVLNSMHRYQPRIHLVRLSPEQNIPTTPLELKELPHKTFVYPESVFTAVTAYQNQLITKLKIDSNPFAKGFRDSSRLTDFDFERDPREAIMREQQLRSSFGLLADPVMAQFMHQQSDGSSATFLERARQNLQILQRFPFTELLLPQFFQTSRQWMPTGFPILPPPHPTNTNNTLMPSPTSPGESVMSSEVKTKAFQRFHPYAPAGTVNHSPNLRNAPS